MVWAGQEGHEMSNITEASLKVFMAYAKDAGKALAAEHGINIIAD